MFVWCWLALPWPAPCTPLHSSLLVHYTAHLRLQCHVVVLCLPLFYFAFCTTFWTWFRRDGYLDKEGAWDLCACQWQAWQFPLLCLAFFLPTTTFRHLSDQLSHFCDECFFPFSGCSRIHLASYRQSCHTHLSPPHPLKWMVFPNSFDHSSAHLFTPPSYLFYVSNPISSLPTILSKSPRTVITFCALSEGWLDVIFLISV